MPVRFIGYISASTIKFEELNKLHSFKVSVKKHQNGARNLTGSSLHEKQCWWEQFKVLPCPLVVKDTSMLTGFSVTLVLTHRSLDEKEQIHVILNGYKTKSAT